MVRNTLLYFQNPCLPRSDSLHVQIIRQVSTPRASSQAGRNNRRTEWSHYELGHKGQRGDIERQSFMTGGVMSYHLIHLATLVVTQFIGFCESSVLTEVICIREG
jgi:hypothetical protein